MSLPEKKIKTVQLPDSNTYEIIPERLQKNSYEAVLPSLTQDSVLALSSDIKYIPHFPSAISGTEAVSTTPHTSALWDATCDEITNLYDGMVMIIRVPVKGSDNYGVALKVNNGAYHPVVYGKNITIGDRYAVNSTIIAVYNATQTAQMFDGGTSLVTVTGVWQVYDYDTDTQYRLRNQDSVYINKSGQSTNRRTLLFEVEGGLSATNTTITTSTSKTPINFKYIPGGQIRYYSVDGTVSANGKFSISGLWEQFGLDIRYSFNTGSTLVEGSPVYIRMIVNSDGTLSQDASSAGDNPIVQALPSTADNKVYVYLGRAGSVLALELEPVHPIYEYKDGAIRLWTNAAATGGGTVTSVGMTVPTGLSVSGSPITSSGTLAVTYASGYSIPSTANQTAWTNKQDALVSGTNIKTINSQSILGSGNIEIDVSALSVETTYSALKALRDNSQLVPGTWYRITDYTTTTTQTNTSSAGHQFDIIVKADSVNKLNENAYAIQHTGDTYFANSNLSVWQLWYSLDNDTNRFLWADSTNGKGVIYRMIDEFGNDVPYDFKNILFTKSEKYTNAYTFSYTENNTIKDASLLGSSKSCYNNIIKNYILLSKQQLNFNVFYSTSSAFSCYDNIFESQCSSNTFGNSCYSNIFGNSCSSNTFGGYCYDNTFGNYCSNNTCQNGTGNRFGYNCSGNIFGSGFSGNTFGSECTDNTFGNICYSNIFGDECSEIIFGNSCWSNTFGEECSGVRFGNYCSNNTFGNNCNGTFGDECSGNIFGNNCYSITFGNSSSTINYVQHIKIDSGCQCLYINSTDTSASSSNYLQNVHVHLGIQGTDSSWKTITIPDRNLPYETNVYLDTNGNIEMVVNSGGGGGGTAETISYTTTAPSANNPTGIKFVILEQEPATRYSGYYYIITGGSGEIADEALTASEINSMWSGS